MKTLRIISRTILGLTFMFSGFVKGVDPLGFSYKLLEYFEAYHMQWLNSLVIFLVLTLFVIEFTIGVMLVFGVKPKLSSWLAFLMMFFFTGLTLLSAINNPVSDCGCFGDAIKLTNWQTFYKNVVLIIFALVLIFTNKYARPAFTGKIEIIVTALGAGTILFVSIYSLRHLPLIDFLPWKVGNKISEQVVAIPEKSEPTLIYKDKVTGKRDTFTSKTLPWKDSVKMSKLEFVDQGPKKIIQEFKEAPIHDFVINDLDGNILNDKIVANPGFQFILVSYDLNKTQKKAYATINKFVEGCDKDTISFVGLTGSIPETIDSFRHEVQAMFPFYNVDETALKSMIRSNPGLLLLKNGKVIAKWAWRDIPEYSKVKEKFLKK